MANPGFHTCGPIRGPVKLSPILTSVCSSQILQERIFLVFVIATVKVNNQAISVIHRNLVWVHTLLHSFSRYKLQTNKGHATNEYDGFVTFKKGHLEKLWV